VVSDDLFFWKLQVLSRRIVAMVMIMVLVMVMCVICGGSHLTERICECRLRTKETFLRYIQCVHHISIEVFCGYSTGHRCDVVSSSDD